jgi:hypothetical protein
MKSIPDKATRGQLSKREQIGNFPNLKPDRRRNDDLV